MGAFYMAVNTNHNAILFLVASSQAAASLFMDRHEQRMRRHSWSDQELGVIRKYYITKGSKFCHYYLPMRSIHSIRHKARELGLLRESKEAWQRSELDVVIRGVSRDAGTKEILLELNQAGFLRTFIAVRDCRLAIMKKYA